MDFYDQDLYAEAVHNLAQKWPDEQSLEVSYRDIEGFDDEFAQNIIAHPDLHFQAANQALRQFLQDEGHTSMYPFVRIVHLPSDQIRTVSQLRADDIGMMLAIDAIATKISGYGQEFIQHLSCVPLVDILLKSNNQTNKN